MAMFRVETVEDAATGMLSAEVYFPEDTATPIASTAATYATHEAAIADVVEIMKKAFPAQPIKVVDEA